MSEIYRVVSELSGGYYTAQVVTVICFFMIGLAVVKADRLKGIWAYLYAFPVGLAVFSVGGYLMLCLGIPFNSISVTVLMAAVFAGCLIIDCRHRLVDIKKELLLLMVSLLVVTVLAAVFTANIFDVLTDNDTFYYFSTFPEAIVREGRYIRYFDTFLTDSAPIGSIVYTLPYLFGFGETFGILYMLDLNFLLIFAYALYRAQRDRYTAAGAACISAVTTAFLATSSAYLTTAKWVMAGVYFMSYYFFTVILGYEVCRDTEQRPCAVLMLMSVMTAMLRHEGIIFVLVLVILLSVRSGHSLREVLLTYILPVFICAGLYYIRVFAILKVAPLYAFLTPAKGMLLLAAVVCTGLLVCILHVFAEKKTVGFAAGHMYTILPAVLMLLNLMLLVLRKDEYLVNLRTFYGNLRTRAGWGYFGYIAALLVAVLALRAIVRREFRLSFYDSLMISYVLAVVIASFGRGFALRIGVGDSGNRVLLTAVPIIVFGMTMRLMAYEEKGACEHKARSAPDSSV